MMLRRLASTSAKSPSAFRLSPTIRQLLADAPSEDAASDVSITVSGWIKSIRKQKNVSFAVLTDGSSSKGLQAVLLKGKGEQSIASRLANGTAVRLSGRLVPSPGSGQAHELLVDECQDGKVEVLGECNPETYPIQKQALSTEYLRDHTHLRARASHIAAMIRLRDQLRRHIDTWFEEQGFYYTHTPVLTGNDAEGAGEAFRMAPIQGEHPASSLLPTSPSLPTPATPPAEEFFSRPAFLTVSHQLHLEALATALSRVYTLSPCFRAERSLTGRHLAEFWMLEAEWSFLHSNRVEEVCILVEGCLRSVVGDLINPKSGSEDVHALWKDGDSQKLAALQSAFANPEPWTRISYTDAIKELEVAHPVEKFHFPPAWGRPLQSEHERWIAETLVKGPAFITDYPATLKPFYMRANDDGKTVACFDLVVPFVGELVGGSVREERADVLKSKMIDAGLDMEAKGAEGGYGWYEELRRWGGAPHAGFGMGFERLVGWVGGIENVRECIPMPRWAGRMLL